MVLDRQTKQPPNMAALKKRYNVPACYKVTLAMEEDGCLVLIDECGACQYLSLDDFYVRIDK